MFQSTHSQSHPAENRDPFGVGAPMDDPVTEEANRGFGDLMVIVDIDADAAHYRLSSTCQSEGLASGSSGSREGS